jgi:hypothetical protein
VHLVRARDAPVVLSRNEWTRDERGTLVSKKVWHLGRLISVRLRLVVVMALHNQLSSFRLRISSNMPSCSEENHEWNTLANPKGTHFLFCKPSLRNTWTNWHNSRQDYNLEELINQTNRPLNKLHPMSTTSIARTQKSSESSPTKRLVSSSVRIGDA